MYVNKETNKLNNIYYYLVVPGGKKLRETLLVSFGFSSSSSMETKLERYLQCLMF